MLVGLAMGLGVFVNIQSSKNTRSSQETNASAPSNYYNSITDSMSGATLLSNLKSIINTSSVSVSYDWSRYEDADEDPNNSSNVILVYARNSVAKTAHVSGSTGWNREHTFPASKLSNTQAEKDNHIIFASDNKVNGARSNIKMGVVTGGTVVNDYNGNATTCRKTSSLFDPNNVARGIVARSTMYAAAMYEYDPEDNFESIATMLRWHLDYPVTSFDQGRNDKVYTNQHNRNPFVDHPEYACRIWGNTNSTTQSICGSSTPSGSVSISKSSISLTVDQSTTINATSSNSSAISWSTSNPGVVSISSSSSTSGTNITIAGVSAGSATITASATISGNTYSATCSVTVTSSGGNTPQADSYSLTNTDMPSSYPSSATEYTAASGLKFYGYQVMNQSGKIQLKNGQGYIYNSESLNLGTLTISGLSGNVTVYVGSSRNPSSTTVSGSNGAYNLSGYNYFKISCNSGSVATCTGITVGISSSTPSQVTSISASVSKTFNVGETISSSDITVKDNNNSIVSTFTFANNNYQFKYSDASSGGASTNKVFANSITAGDLSCSLTVPVRRKAYSSPSTSSLSHTGSEFSSAGIGGSYTTGQTATVDGITFSVDGYIYSNKLSLSSSKTSAPGKVINTTPYSLGITNVVVSGATPDIQLSVDGSKWVDLSSATTSSINYYYLKIFYKTTSQSNYVNITQINVTLKGQETISNVANYIMYEDTNNQCNSKLDVALCYFQNLSSADKNTFSTSNDYVISTARTRLEAWATSKGKTINYSNGSLSSFNKLVSFTSHENNNAIIMLVILSIAGVSAIGACIYTNNKKSSK